MLTQIHKTWNNQITQGRMGDCDIDGPEPKRAISEWDKEYALPGLAHVLRCALRAEWKADKLLSERIAKKEQNELFSKLEIAATSGNERAFLSVFKDAELGNISASDLVKIIRLALKAGAHLAARQISSEGLKRYPDNSDIQKYARGLAAPRVISRSLPPNPTLQANREWLERYSENYRGQWVAIRNGELLGTAGSLKELTKKVPNGENILFTQVR